MPDTAETERYRAAWKDYRRRTWIAAGLMIAAVAGVLAASGKLAAVGIAITVMLAAVAWRQSFRCPRCGGIFYEWLKWTRLQELIRGGGLKCGRCGLELNEIPGETTP
ncbi:MAG TPA: hypothetical protein VMI56_25800 [Reyranella sp.]|nr:hypothetical protein [Reyranella sp.]